MNSSTKTYHIYTKSQCEYLINTKLPPAKTLEMEKFRDRFVAKFKGDPGWNNEPKKFALHSKTTRLQQEAKRWNTIDKYLDIYLGQTLSPNALRKITQQINDDLHETFAPKEIRERLELLTEQAGGSNQPIVDESLANQLTAPEKDGRRKYTEEHDHFLLSEGLKVAKPAMKGSNKSPTLHSTDMKILREKFRDAFGLDPTLSSVTEKVRNLIKRHRKQITDALSPEPQKPEEPQKPKPAPKKNRSQWEVIVNLASPVGIWKGESEPSINVVQSVKEDNSGKRQFLILINDEVKWGSYIKPVVLKCELC